MDQTLINWLLGGFGTLVGFVLNSMGQAVKDLQTADKDISAKVAGVEVLVAGAYVRKDDLNQLSHAVFAKLDRIEGKLDGKADK